MAETLAKVVAQQQEEKIRLVRWHRQNACKRQGMPYEDSSDPVKVEVEVRHDGGGPPPAAPSPAAPTTQPDKTNRWLPWALAAMGAAGGATAINLLWPDSPTPTPVEVRQDGDGSLLQWLEDTGEHLDG